MSISKCEQCFDPKDCADEQRAINAKLDYCERNCTKYYGCDTVAELNDKLKD